MGWASTEGGDATLSGSEGMATQSYFKNYLQNGAFEGCFNLFYQI